MEYGNMGNHGTHLRGIQYLDKLFKLSTNYIQGIDNMISLSWYLNLYLIVLLIGK